MDPCRFHVQVAYREWVIWGYGRNSVEHIEPALVRFSLPIEGREDLEMEFPFKLPKRFRGGGKPQEYRRVVCWGWRLKSNNLIHDTGWDLAESYAALLDDARAYCARHDQRSGSVRAGLIAPMADALNDIRLVVNEGAPDAPPGLPDERFEPAE